MGLWWFSIAQCCNPICLMVTLDLSRPQVGRELHIWIHISAKSFKINFHERKKKLPKTIPVRFESITCSINAIAFWAGGYQISIFSSHLSIFLFSSLPSLFLHSWSETNKWVKLPWNKQAIQLKKLTFF